MKKYIFLAFLTASFFLVYSSSIKAAQTDTNTPWNKYYFEFSFGNSILFLDQAYQSNSAGSVKKNTLPVASYLFLTEWRMSARISFAAAWNLPFTSVKRVSGSTISDKHAAPSYGGGVSFFPLSFELNKTTYIEPEFSMLLFRTYHSTSKAGDFTFPMGAFKLNIVRNAGMNIYIGVTQAPAKNTTALVYGIGLRF